MLKAILFDLDNTLLDFLSFKIETAKAAAKEMVRQGLPCTELQVYGKIFSVYEEKGIEYQKTFHDVIVPFNLPLGDAERIQQAAIIVYLKKKFEILRPYPSVRSTLIRLHTKYSLGIVTDAPRNKAWQRLVLAGLEREFDFLVSHDDTLNPTASSSLPHFNLALAKLNILPSSVLFVGDNLDRDIVSAKEAGIMTCWAKYGSNKKSTVVHADFEINKFEDLIKIVEKLSN